MLRLMNDIQQNIFWFYLRSFLDESVYRSLCKHANIVIEQNLFYIYPHLSLRAYQLQASKQKGKKLRLPVSIIGFPAVFGLSTQLWQVASVDVHHLGNGLMIDDRCQIFSAILAQNSHNLCFWKLPYHLVSPSWRQNFLRHQTIVINLEWGHSNQAIMKHRHLQHSSPTNILNQRVPLFPGLRDIKANRLVAPQQFIDMKQQHQKSNGNNKIKELLIEHYKSLREIPSLVKGISDVQFTLDQQFIQLKLVYDDQKLKNQPIQLHQLLDQISSKQQANQNDKAMGVVIKGGPGTGKSILMNKIAYEWAVHESNKTTLPGYKSERREFEYVFRLNLKTIISRQKRIKQGDEMLYSFLFQSMETKSMEKIFGSIKQKQFIQKMQQIFKNAEKGKLLILLDGYDEVSHEEGSDSDAGRLLKDLMDSVKPFNTVITSRPEAVQRSNQLKNYERVIQVQQLEQQTILKFIQSMMKNNREKEKFLKNKVMHNRSILKMIQSPLNLTMVCLLVISDKENTLNIQALNQIDLYHKIIGLLVGRFELQKQSVQKGNQRKEQLEQKIQRNIFNCVPLQHLKKLIVRSFKAGKITVDYQQITTLCQEKQQEINNILKFGLLKKNNSNQQTKASFKGDYQFIHLSFAEYLAAYSFLESLRQNTDDYCQIAEFIAQRRYQPTYFNTFRYLTMLCSKEYYSSKANTLPLETLSTCFTCNIDGTLQFGNEKRLRLLMEMISLSQIFRKNFPGKPSLIKAAEDFISRIFDLEEKDEQSSKSSTQLLIRWYNYFIDSEYLPAFFIKKLSQRTQPILSKLDKQQTISLSKVQEELIKVYCELSSSLIYLKSWNQTQKQSSIRTFFTLVKQTRNLPLRLLALTAFRKLQVYLSQDQLQKILIKDRQIEKLLACLKDKTVHKQSFGLIIACQKRIPIEEQGNVPIRIRVLQQLKHIMSDEKSQIEEALILEELYDEKVSIASQANPGKIKQQICQIYSKIIKERKLEGSDPSKINGFIRKDMFNIFRFLIKDEKVFKLLELNKHLEIMDKKNTECQLKIKADQQISQRQSNKILKDLRKILQEEGGSKTKDQLQQLQVFYMRTIPDGFGKYLKRNSLFKLLQRYQSQNTQQEEIENIAFISKKVINHVRLNQREDSIVSQLFQTLSKKGKTTQLPRVFNQVKGKINENNVCQINQAHIIPLLKYHINDVRCQAVKCISQSLPKLKQQSMLNIIQKHIVPLLNNNDYNLRLQALQCITQSLPKLMQQSAVKIVGTDIVPLLKDYDINVRRQAAQRMSQFLPKLKQQSAVRIVGTNILPLLKDNNDDVRRYAVQYISQSLPKMKQQITVRIVGTDIVPLLKDNNDDVRRQALECINLSLPKMKQQSAVKAIGTDIVPLLKDNDYFMRRQAVLSITQHLPKFKQQSAIKIIEKNIVPLLKNNDIYVRRQAVQCFNSFLPKMKQQSAVKIFETHIVPLLKDKNDDVRRQAVQCINQSLPKLKQQSAVKIFETHIVPLLKDNKDDVRCQAVKCFSSFLPRLKQQNAVKIVENAIVPLLKDKNDYVRRQAVQCFSQFLPKLKQQSAVKIVGTGIVPLLKDKDINIHHYAVQCINQSLPKLKQQSAVKIVETHMVQLLKDDIGDVRAYALQSITQFLPKLKQQSAVKIVENAIVPLLKDNKDYVRRQAVQCISKYLEQLKEQSAGKIVETHIVLLLKDNKDYVRRQAVQCISKSLMKLKEQSAGKIVETHIVLLLKDSNDDVRLQALQCISLFLPKLKQQRTVKIVETHIVQLLKDNHYYVRRQAVQRITQFLPKLKQQSAVKIVVTDIVPLLKDDDFDVRRYAVKCISQSLPKLKQQSAVKIVETHMAPLLNNNDSAVRLYAVQYITQSLPKLKQQIAVKIVEADIVPLLKDYDNNMRREAAQRISQFLPKLKQQSAVKIVETHIVPLLKDYDTNVRRQAAQRISQFLPKLKQQIAVKIVETHIVTLLKDNDRNNRYNGVQSFSQFLPKLKEWSAVKIVETDIVPLLKDYDINVRRQAAQRISQFLPKLKQQSAVRIVGTNIVPLLKDNNDFVRLQALQSIAQCLSKLKQQSAIKVVGTDIVSLLKDNDNNVRLYAVKCISQFLPKLKQQSVVKIAVTIIETHIVPLLKNNIDDVRLSAVQCISQFLPRLKQQRAIKIVGTDLIPLLKDNNDQVRMSVLNLLIRFHKVSLTGQSQSPSIFWEKATEILTSLLQYSLSWPQQLFNVTLSFLHKYLALVVQKSLLFQKYSSRIYNQIIKISKATLSISQMPAQTKILQVADNLIRLKCDQKIVEDFCSILFQNDGILERQHHIIRDKLRVHQFLNGIVINRIRKDEKLLSGANYKALVELSKANAKIYDTILQMYKIPLEQTYNKVKQEGENSQTLKALRQQLKNKELDIHSYFAQELLKKLIVLAIEDQEISLQNADLVYFCVQSNLTITFTYTPNIEPNDFKNNFLHSYSIVFAGKSYPMQKGLEQYFGLMRKLFDGYGKLYAKHSPQFINDGKHGLKKAAIDMAGVKEVFIDHDKILTRNNKFDRFIDWDKVIVIALKQGQQQFYLLSRRDEFGNISVTKIQHDKETCFILSPYKLDNQTLRKFKQEVIGIMQDNFYQLSVFSVGKIPVLPKSKQQLQQIIINLQSLEQSVSKWKLLGEKVRPYKYLARDVQDIQQILQKTGTAKKSSLIKQLQNLGDTEEQKSKIRKYSTTALFKLHYIVEAFSLLSTEMFQQNKDFRFNDELKYTDLAKTIVDTASEYIDLLPMFGDFVTKVTGFVKSKLQARQAREQSNQKVVFLKIFRQNSSDPSDQALLIQEVVLQLTKLRKTYLLSGKEKQEQNLTILSVFNQIKGQIDQIGLQKELKGQDQVDKSAILACTDVITFVMSIVNKKEEIMEMSLKRDNIVKELMTLFREKHESDEKGEVQGKQGCFGRAKYCLYLYENCCCIKQDISKQFEGLSCFEKFKRYFFACFCCFRCCGSPRNQIDQSEPQKMKEKSSKLDIKMQALSSQPNSRQTLVNQSSVSPKN